jgi:hypothetical protein
MRRFDLTPLLLLIPLLLALLPDGLPNTADMHVHFIRAAEMVHAWQDGVWVPRWSANLGYGYGIPLFNYAPPLPYFLTAMLHMLGAPLEIALKGTLIIALLIAAWGSYTGIRSSFGTLAGAVGSVAFVYAPYRLRELFIQGNVGQLLAWSFIPWAVWGVARLWETGRIRYGVVIALAVAGALLSHNVVALVLGIILAVQTIGLVAFSFFTGREGYSPTSIGWARALALLKVAFAGIGGLALAAWFSIPALLEGDFIQLDKIVASDYRARFVPFQELIALSPALDRAAVNPYLPLTLGAVQVGVALVGAFLWAVAGRHSQTPTVNPSPKEKGWSTESIGGYMALGLLGAVMAHRISLPLWEILPFADLFEFPARWHGFTALGLAGLAGAAVGELAKHNAKWGVWVGGIAITLLFLSSLVNLYPQRLPLGTWQSTPADVVQFEVATGAVGTTSLAEFNPVWRTLPLTESPLLEDYRAYRTPDRIERRTLPASAIAETLTSRTESHHLRFTLTQPATITLNLLYFPGWTAYINGVRVSAMPEPETGLIQLPMPAGSSEVFLQLEDTPLRQGSEWLSLMAWVGLGAIVIRKGISYRSVLVRPQVMLANGRMIFGVLIPIIAAFLVFPDSFAPTSPPDTARPAHQPQRVDWGEDLRLLGVDLPDQLLNVGETVTVVAYVRALRPIEQEYAVYLHLDDALGQTVATSDQRHPAEIPTSNLPPSLYVRIPFQITIPSDLPPMNYTWRLGWHDPETNTPLLVADGQKDVELGMVWLESPEISTPTGETATFNDTIHLQSATLNRPENSLSLIWETTSPITEDITIFVHLLDANGQKVGQVDGDPFDNRYRLTAWRVGHQFEETRAFPNDMDYTSVAIGIYRRTDGSRLPAFRNQLRLANDTLFIK